MQVGWPRSLVWFVVVSFPLGSPVRASGGGVVGLGFGTCVHPLVLPLLSMPLSPCEAAGTWVPPTVGDGAVGQDDVST